MNGQKNLTKLQLNLQEFVDKIDFLTEEQKSMLLSAQSMTDQMAEKASKLDKLSALKLAQGQHFTQQIDQKLNESDKKFMQDIIAGRE